MWSNLFLLLSVLPSFATVAASENPDSRVYVRLRSGAVEAVADSLVMERYEKDGSLHFVLRGDTVLAWPLAEVTAVTAEPPADPPVFASFKFKSAFNHNLLSDVTADVADSHATVRVGPAIGKRLTPSFRLSADDGIAYVDGKRQRSNRSRQRFDAPVRYILTRPGYIEWVPAADRTQTAAGRYASVPFGRETTVDVTWATDGAANVPRVDIVTETGVPPADKVNYVAATIAIDGGGVFPDMPATPVAIRGRGNSSWAGQWGKSPYRLKFDTKERPLGLSAGKNWVLQSNRQPGSMTTNAIAMKLASLLETAGANHVIPVELYLNGEYRGSYAFTEKVGTGANSLDLDDRASVLLEADIYYDEPYKFRDRFYDYPVNVKKPDFAESGSFFGLADVEEDFNRLTRSLAGGTDSYADLIDVDLTARYLLMNEIVVNLELSHPKSIFLYKENLLSPSSPYVFGPCWDYDWAFGYGEQFRYFRNCQLMDFYGLYLLAKTPFASLRHNSTRMREAYDRVLRGFLREGVDELVEYAGDYYAYARPSFEHNAQRWPEENTDYGTLTDDCRLWLRNRIGHVARSLADDGADDIPAGDADLPTGDANADGLVTVADAMCILNRLQGRPNESFESDLADTDASQSVTATDAETVLALALSADIPSVAFRRQPRADASLSTSAQIPVPAADFEVQVAVDCKKKAAISGGQMDIVLPEGAGLADVRFASAPAGFELRHAALASPDRWRVMFHATTADAILPKGKNVLVLKLSTDSSPLPDHSVVGFENILLAKSDGESCRLPGSASLLVADATGTETVTAEQSLDVRGGDCLSVESPRSCRLPVTTVDGRTVCVLDVRPGRQRFMLAQGIYIVAGRKVVVR